MTMPGDVVIAIPTLNEAATIEGVLDHFLADSPDAQIVVADGGSTDDTLGKVRRYGPQVHLLDNPDRIQATAMNRAARWARDRGAEVMIRADAHAVYPAGFVRGLVATLRREQADSVVVPLLAEGTAGWQAANAALQTSWLGHGGSPHRKRARSGPVTHGHHAAFRLSAFLALDGYDPGFAAAEDVEFDYRLIHAGGRIVIDGARPVGYLPRARPVGVFWQYRRNGAARARFWRKHGILPSPRQALPFLAGSGWIPSLALGLAWPVAALPGLAYLALVLVLSAQAAVGHRVGTLRVASLALLTHGGYAIGILQGLLGQRYRKTTEPVPT
jgi:succinoglycan biosynthesis protein ExoA